MATSYPGALGGVTAGPAPTVGSLVAAARRGDPQAMGALAELQQQAGAASLTPDRSPAMATELPDPMTYWRSMTGIPAGTTPYQERQELAADPDAGYVPGVNLGGDLWDRISGWADDAQTYVHRSLGTGEWSPYSEANTRFHPANRGALDDIADAEPQDIASSDTQPEGGEVIQAGEVPNTAIDASGPLYKTLDPIFNRVSQNWNSTDWSEPGWKILSNLFHDPNPNAYGAEPDLTRPGEPHTQFGALGTYGPPMPTEDDLSQREQPDRSADPQGGELIDASANPQGPGSPFGPATPPEDEAQAVDPTQAPGGALGGAENASMSAGGALQDASYQPPQATDFVALYQELMGSQQPPAYNADPARDEEDFKRMLVETGLGMMAASSQPGATAFGALGAGAMNAMNADDARRTARAERELEAQNIAYERQGDMAKMVTDLAVEQDKMAQTEANQAATLAEREAYHQDQIALREAQIQLNASIQGMLAEQRGAQVQQRIDEAASDYHANLVETNAAADAFNQTPMSQAEIDAQTAKMFPQSSFGTIYYITQEQTQIQLHIAQIQASTLDPAEKERRIAEIQQIGRQRVQALMGAQ